MKLLPDSFRLDGFDFRLIKRTQKVALFEKSKSTHRDPCYEVVLIQVWPANKWPDGTTSPVREAMPKSEDWGSHGWSYSDRQSAEARWKALTDSHGDELGASEPSKALSTCGGFVGPQTPQKQPTCPPAKSDTEIGDSRRDGKPS